MIFYTYKIKTTRTVMESTRSLTFEDPSFTKENVMLLADEADARSATLSDVKYNLIFLLNASKPFYRGLYKVQFKLANKFKNSNVFIDF